MFYLTEDGTLYDNTKDELPNLEPHIRAANNIFKLLQMYDFVYTQSEKGEDVGFVTETTQDYFVVTFTHRNTKVKFKYEDDKKLRLIKELWTRTNAKTFRRFWISEDYLK